VGGLIVGTTAGALIGLQFVVLTLITEASMIRGIGESLRPASGSAGGGGGCRAIGATAGPKS
jgi:hypothetical protein